MSLVLLLQTPHRSPATNPPAAPLRRDGSLPLDALLSLASSSAAQESADSSSSSRIVVSLDAPDATSPSPAALPPLPLRLRCMRAPAVASTEQAGPALVAIWAVPAAMAKSRLLALLEPMGSAVTRLLWIQSPTAGLYMVVLETTSETIAEQIRLMYSGVPFWPGGTETAIVAHVSAVTVVAEEDVAELCRRENLGPELPTCPHCLLRLDEPVQDLLLPQNRERTLSRPDSTTPAAEVASAAAAVFAGAAGSRSMDGTLDLWPDVSCLVCQLLRGGSRRAVCCECGEDGQSYVCLLCGSVGCGRQQHAHGLAHFRSTGHPFSAELHTGRIWDYERDIYVHHLAPVAGAAAKSGLVDDPDKVKQMRLRDEYVQLLSQQLESQRQYFTSKLNRLELEAQAQVTALMDDIETNRKMADSLQLQVSHHEGEAETLKTDVAALEAELKAQLAALTAMRQRRQQLTAATANVREKQANDERQVVAVQEQLKQQIQALKDEVADLKRHIVQSNQLAGADVAAGHVIITQSENDSPRRRSGGGSAAAGRRR